MRKYITSALLWALAVLFFSGCELTGVGTPDGGGSNTGENGWPEPPAFFKLLEGENSPPNPIIEPTDGSEFLYNSEYVFLYVSVGIKGLFRESISDTMPRPASEVEVYQVMQSTSYGRMVQVAGSVDSLCFTEHQLIEFVQQNKEWVWDNSYRTFALFKIGGKVRLASIIGGGIELVELSDQTIREVTPVRVGSGPDASISGYYWRIIVPKQG